MSVSLAGCRVWLSRPAGQSGRWQSALETAGARVIQQPLLDIGGAPRPAAAGDALRSAQHADIVIVTSVNAVAGAWRLWPSFAPRGQLMAVGDASAAALAQATGREVAVPSGRDDSEGLLAVDGLAAVAAKRVVILGGAGGRSALVETLTARGAIVDKIALYRRIPTAIEPHRFATCADQSDVIVVTSGEALSHLLGLAERFDVPLYRHGLVAPSVRVVQQASHAVEWATPPVALERMGATHVVEAIARIWSRR